VFGLNCAGQIYRFFGEITKNKLSLQKKQKNGQKVIFS